MYIISAGLSRDLHSAYARAASQQSARHTLFMRQQQRTKGACDGRSAPLLQSRQVNGMRGLVSAADRFTAEFVIR